MSYYLQIEYILRNSCTKQVLQGAFAVLCRFAISCSSKRNVYLVHSNGLAQNE